MMNILVRSSTLLLMTTVLLSTGTAHAHRLIQVNDQPLNAQSALIIEDIAVSQVAYHVVSESAPQLWLSMEAEAGEEIYFETGIPFIERLQADRPISVLIGPGLPETSLPFVIPEGLGALVFDTSSVVNPEVFDEPFTGTQSWKFGPWETTAPQSGQYFLVSYLAGEPTGKVWTAVGRAESFGIEDILSLPETIVSVRGYHEVSPWGGILGWGLVGFLALLVNLVRLLLS